MASKKRPNNSLEEKFSWTPRNDHQREARIGILEKEVSFLLGCAGTGKTTTALYTAFELIEDKKSNIHKIILSRPCLGAGEDLGFMPGTWREKQSPFMMPLYDLVSKSKHPQSQLFLDQMLNDYDNPVIDILPTSLMLGITIDHTILIIDDSQNLTPLQYQLILTRLGETGKIVFCGDEKQLYLKGKKSGLEDAVQKFHKSNYVNVVRFTKEDICRSGFVKEVIEAYNE